MKHVKLILKDILCTRTWETEMPNQKDFYYKDGADWYKQTEYETALKTWQSSYKDIPVDKSQIELIKDFVRHCVGADAEILLKQGIDIDPSLIEVREVEHLLSDPPKPVLFSFLKQAEPTAKDLAAMSSKALQPFLQAEQAKEETNEADWNELYYIIDAFVSDACDDENVKQIGISRTQLFKILKSKFTIKRK